MFDAQREDVGMAEYGEYRAGGSVTGPISDTVAARLTGYYDDVGGYIRDVATGNELNASDKRGVRGKLEWQPFEQLDVLASADYYNSDSTCCQGVLISTANANLAKLELPVGVSDSNHEINDESLSYANTSQQIFSLRANLALSTAVLTSITAYQKFCHQQRRGG